MAHRLDSLLLRGIFGVALGIAAIAGATSEALAPEREWRFEQGRLVWSERAPSTATCAADTAKPGEDARRRG
jgi:hypothetical protein